jgi:hypothetical protein
MRVRKARNANDETMPAIHFLSRNSAPRHSRLPPPFIERGTGMLPPRWFSFHFIFSDYQSFRQSCAALPIFSPPIRYFRVFRNTGLRFSFRQLFSLSPVHPSAYGVYASAKIYKPIFFILPIRSYFIILSLFLSAAPYFSICLRLLLFEQACCLQPFVHARMRAEVRFQRARRKTPR